MNYTGHGNPNSGLTKFLMRDDVMTQFFQRNTLNVNFGCNMRLGKV